VNQVLESRLFNFDDSMTIGSWAEDRFIEYLQGKGYRVIDVREDPKMRQLDVDLIAHAPAGDATWLEVKGDTHSTSNVYIEVVSSFTSASGRTEGCILKTAAHLLVYYFVNQGFALLIPVPALQAWVAAGGINQFNRASPRNTQRSGRVTKSLGFTVPIFRLVQNVPGIKKVVGLPRMTEVYEAER
jgi:hypothetical protein